MQLLLLSNSRNPGMPYLSHAAEEIARLLGGGPRRLAFVPYAGVRIGYDEYEERVREAIGPLGYEVISVHRSANPAEAIQMADAVVVGGGNTFQLLRSMWEEGLIEAIRESVRAGQPYIGWSAGSNVACPSICTTNDMPIVHVSTFEALNLVPFQINPHFTDARIENHGGETRSERIEEYLELNRERIVVGLPEGTMLKLDDGRLSLIGGRPMKVFQHGEEPREMHPGSPVEFLMQNV